MYRTRSSDVWPARYKTGMWVWILHRVTGVIIALYGMAHLSVITFSRVDGGAGFDRVMSAFSKPYVKALELVLLAVIIYHTLNGLRVILFDLGIGVRVQKQLFWGLMAVGAVFFVLVTLALIPHF